MVSIDECVAFPANELALIKKKNLLEPCKWIIDRIMPLTVRLTFKKAVIKKVFLRTMLMR